jgi:cytoskeletal protein CcmA (bactofilin family)
MKISGSGRLSEGKINDKVSVSGSAKIEGDFECDGFRVSGSVRGSGNLTVHGDVRSSGTFRISGSLYGDGTLRSSGTASVGGEVLIKGVLSSSGTLKVGSKVEAFEGIRSTGTVRIRGDLLSNKNIDLNGSTSVDGDVKADNVFMGTSREFVIRLGKHPYRVNGNIYSENKLSISKAYVTGDVRGRDVKIGKGAEILGNVYYIDNIDVNSRAKLANDPIKIEVNQYK